MKPLFIFLLFPFFLTAQNTIGGKKVIIPEEEVNRQSAFLDAERERLLGNWDKAIDIYKKFLLENPTNDAGLYGLARSQAGAKDMENAVESIRRAIAADPTNVWYSTYYADLLEQAGRYAEAAKVYEGLTKTSPDEPIFFQRQAYLATLSGDGKTALKALDRLEKLTGVTEETASKKHLIYVKLGDNKRAAAELQKLADAEPDEPEHLRRLAHFLEEIGDKAAAKPVWEKLKKRNPNAPEAALALVDKAKNSSDAAYLENLKPLFRDPKISIDAKVKELLPFFPKLDKGDDAALTQALLELGNLLETAHADDPKAWSLSGDLQYHANHPDAALEKYRRCLGLNPKVFSVWPNTLEILAARHDFLEMLHTAERALDAFPNQPAAYYYYGVAAAETGKMDDAIAQLDQGLLMAGNNLSLRLDMLDALATAFLKKKQPEEVKTRLEPMLGKGGEKHPGILEDLGDAYALAGDRAKALEYWQKANAIRPSKELVGKISGM